MLEKVSAVIKDYKDDETLEITEVTTFEELGLDSLDAVELVMNIEDEIGVSIQMSPDIKTVGDILKVIAEQG